MADNEDLEDKKGPELDDEPEDKPELPQEPVDKNADIEVKVQEGPSRQEKKRNRFRELEERTTRAERAAEQARAEAAEARQSHQRQLYNPQSQQRQPDPLAQRLQQISEAKSRLHAEYEAIASRPGYDRNGPQQKEFERRAEEIETARIATIVNANTPRVNEQEITRKVALNAFLQEHADVTGDQGAWNWAIAQWSAAVHGEGKADTRELAEKILDEARVKFGKKPRRANQPDVATQRRLSGISAQSSGGEAGVGIVKMGSMERKMARAMYDGLPAEQAYQKWANGPGKRAAEKRAVRK
jgi:hypothetical protein